MNDVVGKIEFAPFGTLTPEARPGDWKILAEGQAKRIDALERDMARIDWLSRHEVEWEQEDAGWRVWVNFKTVTGRWSSQHHDGATFREALDVAMDALK